MAKAVGWSQVLRRASTPSRMASTAKKMGLRPPPPAVQCLTADKQASDDGQRQQSERDNHHVWMQVAEHKAEVRELHDIPAAAHARRPPPPPERPGIVRVPVAMVLSMGNPLMASD